MDMYDPLTSRYTFSCPHRGEARVALSDFRTLERLEGAVFLNLMTSRVEPVADELGDLAATRIRAGEWPWSFFCYPEERPRPVFPSSFSLLAPGDRPPSRLG